MSKYRILTNSCYWKVQKKVLFWWSDCKPVFGNYDECWDWIVRQQTKDLYSNVPGLPWKVIK